MSEEWARHLPADAPAPTPAGAGESLVSAFRARWDEDPGAVAVVDLTGGERGERAVTRGELAAGSAAAAALLTERGVGPGERVLLSGAPSLPYLLLYLGALRLGATIVPANTGYTESELRHLVDDSGAALAVVDDPGRVAALGLPTLVPAEAPLADVAEAPPLDRVDAKDLAMIAYTSGTTGRPKGAMLSHGNLLASARAVTISWRWTAADGLVLALPLFHMHGLGVGLHGSLVTGGRILLLAGFSPPAVVAAAARPEATMFFGVPTMHKRLVELAERDAEAAVALRRLRLVVSGSAPLPEELWRRIEAVTGQRVLERYGMTETVMTISNPYEGERRPGTVGFPLPGVEVRIDGGDEEGEILVRGPNVFSGYYGRPEATAESFTADGWFRTGDIGRRAPDGYIAIVGRAKELIISGGYNVYPREVEEVLEQHEDVVEAAVVGAPSEEWGEQVTAFVVPRDPRRPPPVEELVALAQSRLAAYKKPREVRFVEAIPRNELGKVERHRLVASA